jgi:hypothetical protein
MYNHDKFIIIIINFYHYSLIYFNFKEYGDRKNNEEYEIFIKLITSEKIDFKKMIPENVNKKK